MEPVIVFSGVSGPGKGDDLIVINFNVVKKRPKVKESKKLGVK